MYGKLTLALAAGALSLSALAQDDALPSIVVTAARTAQSVDDALAAVSVIDRKTIEASQARSLNELFAGLPGVQLTNSGGYGKPSGVHLRGTNSSHVIVLIDGVRIGSATAGGVAFEQLPLESIDRIEIVRGPASSLYGADAIGGVIQIFTRKGSAQPQRRASLGAGSNTSYRASTGFSGQHDKTRYALDLSRFTTRGYDSTEAGNPDRNGYRRSALNASLQHAFSADNSLSLNLLHSAGDNHYDNTFAPTSQYRDDTVQQVLGARWDLQISERWRSQLSIGESRDDSQNRVDGSDTDRYDTRRHQFTWQNDVQITRALLLTLGAERLQERVDTTQSYLRDTRHNTAFFAQGQIDRGRHSGQLGLRHDDNSSYGGQTTGNLAWGYALGESLRLGASHGTAFKAPSFNDLYWPFIGNPDLRPEKSASSELSLQGRLERGHWALRAWRTRIDNLIAWAPDGAGNWLPGNVNRARIKGVELELGTQLHGWDLGGSLTWLDARDANTDKRLIYRAGETAHLTLGRQIGRLHAQADWIYLGHRYNDEANAQRIGAYGLINALAHYDLDARWRIEARIDNVFKRDYIDVLGYNTPGRTVFLGLRYQGS